LLVTAGNDRKARIWNATTGELLHTLTTDESLKLNSARFNATGEYIIVAGDDKHAKVWTAQGQLVSTLRGHSSSVHSADLHPSGVFAATASEDGSLKLWDTMSATELWSTPLNAVWENSVHFSRDGNRLITSDGKFVRVWNVNSNWSSLDAVEQLERCRVHMGFHEQRVEVLHPEPCR